MFEDCISSSSSSYELISFRRGGRFRIELLCVHRVTFYYFILHKILFHTSFAIFSTCVPTFTRGKL